LALSRCIERRLASLTPRPLRHIPVLIGGSGEKRSLPTVARHADIWHSFPLPIDEYRRKSKLVDELAVQAGRDGNAIERSVTATAPFSTGFDRRSAHHPTIMPARPAPALRPKRVDDCMASRWTMSFGQRPPWRVRVRSRRSLLNWEGRPLSR
jgi:alkanesulfonate monooxygenase SsuD/methylene tetrahydromethanopterin reductase-like flavin-dependent oxidoreductase (luciferase family)